jgi:hypothetical protein
MKQQQNLDQLLADMRAQEPSEEVVYSAGKRVFRNVFDSAYMTERVERIKGCPDFQKLIPSYLDGSLAASRVALLEDHVSQCVECRKVLRREKEGNRPGEAVSIASARARRKHPVLPWALAAALAAGTAIGVTGAFNGLLPGQHAVRATVVSVQGTLYKVSDVGSSLLEAGAVIRNAEELRTAKGSRAIFRLVNGAQVEMGERSDVSVSRSWRGTSLDVERGQVIVQAVQNGSKPFLVAAGDLRIPARNSIFAVNRGVKGTRVAMAKGSAKIQNGEKTMQLNAGDQENAGYRLVNASLTSEFAWSQNADYYTSLLKDLSTLQKQIQAIPSQPLRYSSALAKYLPANTKFYAAIPNVGGTITEAKHLFDQRLAESEVLRDWWQKQPASRNGDLDRALSQISAISQYLGDEIVISMASSAGEQNVKPVFLASVRQPGLREYLQQNIPQGADVRFVDASSTPAPVKPDSLFISLDENLVVASPELTAVEAIVHSVANQADGGFVQTPFYQRIAHSYSIGVGYLLAIDMEQIVSKSVPTAKGVPPGFDNMQYLMLERRDVSGDTENRATLSFTGQRQGVASWLGAPGPMGSLDFVTPEANFAVSAVLKTPLKIVQELINYATHNDSDAPQKLGDLENQLGVRLADDIAAPIGGDATFAIDGPLVPIPSWKLIVEVYDANRLQQTIGTVVDHFNQRADNASGRLELSSNEVNSRIFYSLRNTKTPAMEAVYTFVDGYLVAGPNAANLVQAINNREAGFTLASSSAFRQQLPDDSYINFSAIVYHNAGKSLTAAANQLESSSNVPQKQRQTLAALIAASGPGLVCVYGEPDRIVAASKGTFLGFNIGTLAGIEQGHPVLPLIASSARHSLPQ